MSKNETVDNDFSLEEGLPFENNDKGGTTVSPPIVCPANQV